MTAQPTKIEQGSRACMLEAILDVRCNGVLSRAAGPRRESTVVVMRDPRLPAVIVGGDPQPDRLCVLVVGHVHPFSIMAFFHCSVVVKTCSLLRHTCEPISSPLASSRNSHPSS